MAQEMSDAKGRKGRMTRKGKQKVIIIDSNTGFLTVESDDVMELL